MIWNWCFKQSPLRSWEKQIPVNSKPWLFMRLECDMMRWVHTRWVSGRRIISAQSTVANTKGASEQALRKRYLSMRNSSTKSQSNSWTASSRYHSLMDKIIRTVIKSENIASKAPSTWLLYSTLKRDSKANRDLQITQCLDDNFSSCRHSFS